MTIKPITRYGCSRLVPNDVFALNTGREIAKLVVNNCNQRKFNRFFKLRGECHRCGFRVRELVFVFHASQGPGWMRAQAEDFAEAEAVVQADTISAQGPVWAEGVCRRPGPARVVCRHEDDLRCGQTTLLNVRYPKYRPATLGEYRAEIGERELAIETDFINPLRP